MLAQCPATKPGAWDTPGTLPFTGLFVGFLALAGAMALAGGIGLRRAAADDPQDSSELAGLSGRRADVSRQAFAWADSVAARSATLEERLTTLERSLPS